MLKWFNKFLLRKRALSVGDLVQDIGDGFERVEDPGIVIQIYEDRYTYRHPLFLGLLPLKVDGITVRWLDKKGTSHIYPSLCVKKLEVSEEKAEALRTTAAERFEKPESPAPESTDDQLGFPFDDLGDELTEPVITPPPAVEKKTKELSKMKKKLKEVEKIIEDRKKAKQEGEEQ